MAHYHTEILSRSDTNDHKDFRSKRRIKSRRSKQSAKYYGYRGVHPSWVDQPYLTFPNMKSQFGWTSSNSHIYASCDPLVTDASDAKVATWTKRDMWHAREENIWPLDRRHHSGKPASERKYNALALGRRMKQRQPDYTGLEEVVELVRDMSADDDSIYWCSTSIWGEFDEEIYNDRGEAPQTAMNLFGERIQDFVEDGPCSWGIYSDLEQGGPSNREDFLALEYAGTDDEDGYSFVSEQDDEDALSVWSVDGEFDMPVAEGG